MSETNFFNEDMASKMFQKVNPFYLRMPNVASEYAVFNQPMDAYYHILTEFFRNCPKGYIELQYILVKIYPFKKLIEIKRMAAEMVKLKVPEVIVLDYESKTSRIYFEGFFTALHSLCGTEMNHDAFKRAMDYTKHMVDILKANKDIV